MIEFGVLGPVEVAAGGRTVPIDSAKARSLLALLLVEANTAVPNDALADQLWAGSPPGQATAALRVHISHLRKALHTVHSADQLVTRPAGYLLQLAPDQLDAQRFAGLAERGRAELAAQRPWEASATLQEAEALWRGAAFADIPAMPSVDAERARLNEQRLAVTEARIEAELACGRHPQVVSELEHLTMQHPLRERLWEQRILGLYRCGRQADALVAYETVRALLDNDLGLRPGPALTRLQTSVLRQDPQLEWAPTSFDAPPTASPPAQRRPRIPGRLHALAAVPLVGREPERRSLRRLWSAARQGRAQLVLIQGAAGSGKTHLCADLAAHAVEHGATVGYGGCDQRALAPLQPIVEAFGRHLATPEARPGDTSRRQRSARLAPRPLGGDLSTPVDSNPPAIRREMFEAMDAVLQSGAARHPLLLVLDDLHWADAWSLQLVAHLARRRSDLGPVMVVLGCRPPDAEDSPLVGLLADLARETATDRLVLGGLTRRAVDQLWRSVGLPVGDALPEAVHAATDGNAFYVQEVLRHLAEHGLPAHEPLSVPVPRAVAEVAAGRLAALAAPSRRLLQTAAVAGTEFRLETVAVAAELDQETLLESLDDLLRRGLLAPLPDEGDRHRFNPPLLRAAVYDHLSAARRSHLNRRLTEAVCPLLPSGAASPPSN